MPNWLLSDIVITAGLVGLFAVWISLLEKRIQDLSDQQEERWQRHMENHPKRESLKEKA